MSKTSRRKFTAEFKAKVCREAIKEQQTIEALSKKYDLHPTQINTWKREFLSNSSAVFEKDQQAVTDDKGLIQALYAQIGEQKVAIDFIKKIAVETAGMRMQMVDKQYTGLSIVKQCELLQISRSGFYYQPAQESPENLAVMRVLDEQYLKTPFFGVEKLLVTLIAMGYKINRKRLRRLMKLQGWQTLYPRPRTTYADAAAYKYPYLLRDLAVERKNQVWAIDITYLPMSRGFMYLCAVIDLHTRSRGRLGHQ